MRSLKQTFFPEPRGLVYTAPVNQQDHTKAFQNLIQFIVKLRRKGDIDDRAFKALVRKATANFVEAEVSTHIERIFEDKVLNQIGRGIF